MSCLVDLRQHDKHKQLVHSTHPDPLLHPPTELLAYSIRLRWTTSPLTAAQKRWTGPVMTTIAAAAPDEIPDEIRRIWLLRALINGYIYTLGGSSGKRNVMV